MLLEIKKMLAVWLRHNKNQTNRNQMHNNLIEFIQERICFYSNQEQTPAEQVKGMNRLFRDIINLDEDMFNNE